MTRPQIPIDWERVDELLMCGCMGTEIAAYLGMHEDTFYRRVQEKYNVGFTEYFSKKKATGEAMIREAQYKKALGQSKKGDNTLLIWLGKQRLNQKENASEQVVSETITKSFDALMNQLSTMQEEKQTPQ